LSDGGLESSMLRCGTGWGLTILSTPHQVGPRVRPWRASQCRKYIRLLGRRSSVAATGRPPIITASCTATCALYDFSHPSSYALPHSLLKSLKSTPRRCNAGNPCAGRWKDLPRQRLRS
jgi:hypothetical protein